MIPSHPPSIFNLICLLFLFTFSLGFAESQTDSPAGLSFAGLQVTQPKLEYQTNPFGIDTRKPRFSWILSSDRHHTIQSTYQLQVAESPEELLSGQKIWDTGTRHSQQSIQVVYEGPELSAGKRYYWRVRVADQNSRLSEWSEISWWEMGLLDPDDWQAHWITADLPEDVSKPGPVHLLRREFSLDKNIHSARAYVTSYGVYELEVNGLRAGDHILSPGWTSYLNRLQYQTYDLTDYLHAGENAVGVQLADGWYRGFIGWGDQRNYYGDELALLLQIEVIFDDGSVQIITSDENWKSSTGPILQSDIYNGEWYDARLEKQGWSSAGYPDSDWSGVQLRDHGLDHLIAQAKPPVRVIQQLSPVNLFVTPEGDTVADMGQNLIGWVRLRVNGERGTTVTLRHAEVLDRDGNFYTDNLRSADQTNRYTLRGGGEEIWEPRFTFQGFRYVAIDGYPGELTPESLTAFVLHSDLEPAGHFESSHPMVNQLQHNIVWGQKGNFLDVPTDCPQRDERMGWTGDIQVFAETAHLNMNTALFLTKWLGDLEADQLENGGIPHVIPDVLNRQHGSAGWADAGVMVPWSLYQTYEDTLLLKKQYPSMKAWVEYMRNRAKNQDPPHLWNGDFTFGDWLSFNTTRSDYPGAYTDKDLISSAFYAHSTHLLGKTAAILGYEEDHLFYSDLYGKIRKAFYNEYITPSGRVLSNTQTSYLLALKFDLVPEHLRENAARHLAGNIEWHGHLTTGFLGTPYLNTILTESGYNHLAYELLLRTDYPSWLYPVTRQATTIWERWDGIRPDGTFQNPGMNSFNHYAYGAIGEWLYRYVAGIQQSGPGYQSIQIAPKPGGGLTYARAFVNTPYGRVSSSWEIDGQHIILDVTIPSNTTAHIHLPNSADRSISLNQEPLAVGNGILSVSPEPEQMVVSAGSGRYLFRYLFPDSPDSAHEQDGTEDKGEMPGTDARLGEWIAHPETRAILFEYLPEWMQSPRMSQVMGFPLEYAIGTLPEQYHLPDEVLAAVQKAWQERYHKSEGSGR